MDLSTAPVQVQLEAFTRIVLTNTTAVVDRLPALGVPDCRLAAGARFQTVSNHLAGREPTAGIRDYDVNHFDPADRSWEAEDRVVRHAAEVFADLPAVVEVRNEARVHLWYESRFGVPSDPAEPPPRAGLGLRGEDRSLARGVAGARGAAVARTARRTCWRRDVTTRPRTAVNAMSAGLQSSSSGQGGDDNGPRRTASACHCSPRRTSRPVPCTSSTISSTR